MIYIIFDEFDFLIPVTPNDPWLTSDLKTLIECHKLMHMHKNNDYGL